jgi:hypothetical protein
VPGKPAVQTRVINFYNNQDWVTSDIDRLLEQQRVGWGANQKNDKPDENAGYFLSGAKHIRSGNFIWNRAVTDLEEGLAFGASATHRSLGQEDGLGGT